MIERKMRGTCGGYVLYVLPTLNIFTLLENAMNKREMISGVFCAAIAAAVALPALAQAPATRSAEEIAKAKPSGTITLDETEIRLILGGSSGKGVLTFQGKQYPFTIKGGSAGGIGVQSVHATGNVYFLNKVADFPGGWSAISAGATLVKGVGVSSYQNNKGVYMKLQEKASGAALSLGIEVFDVQFTK